MEALGAAGSIVGILGFIGQSVAGIVKLQAFFDGYKKAPQIAKTLQSDLTSLQATLTDVKAVVQHLENQSWGDIAEAVRANLANLTGFARQCSDDITSWVQVTAGLNPKHKSGFKSFFRKIKIALSGPDTLRSFEADLAKHRQNISNALATLTVNLVLKGHMSLEELSSKLDQFSDTQLKASEAIFDQLGHATVEHSVEIPDDSAEGSLAQLLQDVQVSLENRFDALSEVVGINQEQRDQELRNLYANSQTSTSYGSPLPGSPVHGSPMNGSPRFGPSQPTHHWASASNASSFDMASICSSLSSIAASLSAIPHQRPLTNSGEHPTHDIRPAEASEKWSCDSLSGIDDARYTFKHYPHQEMCLFCDEEFMMKTLDDPEVFGKHLVYKHYFGQCDLNQSFGSWEELRDHLIQFHRAEPRAIHSCSTAYGRFHPRGGKIGSSSKHPYFSDTTGASRNLEIYEEYAQKTDLRLQTKLLEVLVEAGILESRDLANPGYRSDLTCAIKKLNVMCRNSATSNDQEAGSRRSHEAAMIEEQLIVAGYTTAIQARMCPDFKYIYRELRDGCLWAKRQTYKEDGRDRNTFFSHVWSKYDACGMYQGGSLDEEESHLCDSCGDKVLHSASRAHRILFHEMGYVDQSTQGTALLPRGLLASLVTMQEHCGSRLAHRISKWMLLSFVDSASQRELLRTSSLIRKPTLSEQEGGGSHDDAEESWVVPVLRFWNRDGLPIIDEQNTGGGGGSSSPISRERNRASVWSSSPVMRPAASTELVEPILTTMDRSSEDNKGGSLIPPEEDDDDAADGRSASPNSAIWSQEVEPKPEPPVTELGKRAASPSALFEFTAGGPKRIKV